jgi:hypothetical protein
LSARICGDIALGLEIKSDQIKRMDPIKVVPPLSVEILHLVLEEA